MLGCSLHEVLSTVKAEVKTFSRFQLYHDEGDPITSPLYLVLPDNGLRLQFDGPDQRLRLIEVLDFARARLTYKDVDVFKSPEAHAPGSTGPRFRHVYDKLLGPTYGGEYLPPKSEDPQASGTYNLSYPGIAFNFPVKHQAYSPSKDFISLLSSSATGPATAMAVFSGESWQKARNNLFTAAAPFPRLLSLAGKSKEAGPDEIELVKIHGEGKVELIRRASPPLWIVLSETTPQDLIVELGAPDSIYRKNDHRLSIHKDRRLSDTSDHSALALSPNLSDEQLDSASGSVIGTDSQDEWEDAGILQDAHGPQDAAAEHFFNYYSHGFDVLISQPTRISPAFPANPPKLREHEATELSAQPLNHLTVTKIILHGNLPGSYQFNRHRRSRWTIEHVSSHASRAPLSSEMRFNDVSSKLRAVFQSYYEGADEEALQQRGMALNRGWGDSPGSSCELLGGWEDGSMAKTRISSSLDSSDLDANVGNVEIFGFPGLIFEVLKNGAISSLTVY